MPEVGELKRHLRGMRRAVDEADRLAYLGASPDRAERLCELARRMRYHATRFYFEMGANYDANDANGRRFGK